MNGVHFALPSLIAAGLLLVSHTGAQTCGRWEALGVHDLNHGLSRKVQQLVRFDDGSGPEIYAQGGFSLHLPGQVPIRGLARWASTSWEAVLNDPEQVSAIAVFQEPPPLQGDAMYIAAGNRVLRRAGGQTMQIGGTLPSPASALLPTLQGGTPVVYAIAGAPSAVYVLNSQQWTLLGATDGTILTLAMHDSGAGPALHIGGFFTTISGTPARSIARLHGGQWSEVIAGLALNPPPTVHSLLSSGGVLYAAGQNLRTGAAPSLQGVTAFTGAVWEPVGGNLPGAISLAWGDEGSGPALFAGIQTFFAHTEQPLLYRLEGNEWTTAAAAGPAVSGTTTVRSIAFVEGRAGSSLYFGGSFSRAGGIETQNIARMQAGTVHAAPQGARPQILDLAVADLGEGEQLIVGGSFQSVGGVAAANVARFDGQMWSPLGQGVRGVVHALGTGDLGEGPAVFVAGRLDLAGGQNVSNVAQFRAGQWSALGSGIGLSGSQVIPAYITALRVHDDGSGAALYAGGRFGTAGGHNHRHLARWDGQAWSPIAGEWSTSVERFSGGPAGHLYAAAVSPSFNIGGVFFNSIARWTGSNWQATPPLSSAASAMTSLNRSGIQKLFIASGFSPATVREWSGAAWTALSPTMNDRITDLVASHGDDDGLYAVGAFTMAGASHLAHIARHDGAAWMPLGSGLQLEGSPARLRGVFINQPGGPVLYVAGNILSAGGQYSPAIARWVPCGSGCYANCDGSTTPPVLNVDDFTCFINEYAQAQFLPHAQQLTHYANCDQSTIAPVLNVDDFTCFINQYAAGCP
jgi:trimeric autotransporter adhesin